MHLSATLPQGIDFAFDVVCLILSCAQWSSQQYLWCRPQLAVGLPLPVASKCLFRGCDRFSEVLREESPDLLLLRSRGPLQPWGPAGCSVSASTSVVACHPKGCCGRKSSRRASSCSSSISVRLLPGSCDVFALQFNRVPPRVRVRACVQPCRTYRLVLWNSAYSSFAFRLQPRQTCNPQTLQDHTQQFFLLGPDSVDMLRHVCVLCRFAMVCSCSCSCLPSRFASCQFCLSSWVRACWQACFVPRSLSLALFHAGSL